MNLMNYLKYLKKINIHLLIDSYDLIYQFYLKEINSYLDNQNK
jgi:hypothetical protein